MILGSRQKSNFKMRTPASIKPALCPQTGSTYLSCFSSQSRPRTARPQTALLLVLALALALVLILALGQATSPCASS